MIVFAGVSLPLPTRQVCRWIARRMPAWPGASLSAGWPASRLAGLSAIALPRPRQARIGVLDWPVGASRFATFHAVCGGERLDQVRQAVADAGGAADLELGSGGESIRAAGLSLLPPMPLADVPGADGLWLLTLVDDRYWWHGRPAVDDAALLSDGSGTWSDLITAAATACGVDDLLVDEIDPEFGSPPDGLDLRGEPPPVALDAACYAAGLRLVVGLDGSVRAMAPPRSTPAGIPSGRPILAGGLIRGHDAHPALPETAEIAYRSTGSSSGWHVVSQPVTNVGEGLRVRAGVTRRWRTDRTASFVGGGTPTNQADLESYTRAFTRAYVRWQRESVDVRYAGVVPLAVDDLASGAEWQVTESGAWTTTRRAAWDDGVREIIPVPSLGGGGGMSGGGAADENYFRAGATICPVVTNHRDVRTVPQFPDAAEYTITPQIPQEGIDAANAYLTRYYGRTGYWPSGLMDRGQKDDVGLVGLDRDYLYGSPFISPRGQTITDLVAMVNSLGTMIVANTSENIEDDPPEIGAYALRGKLRLSVYATLSTTDLRPGVLLAHTALLHFDLAVLTQYANNPQGYGTLPVGGELFAAADDPESDPPPDATPLTLTPGRLYWFALAWYPERFYRDHVGLPAVLYPLLHLPGSGPRQEIVTVPPSGADPSQELPALVNERPNTWAQPDEPVFGHWFGKGGWHEGGWDDNLLTSTALVGMCVPTGNGIRAKLPTGGLGVPHWETREEGPVLPAAWPLASTKLDIQTYWLSAGETAEMVRSRTFGTPIIHAVEILHDACTQDGCLTADQLCLTLPYSYDADGTTYTGTEQVILQRVQAPWPAIFVGTAFFALGEPDELLVDLALTVDEPDGTGLPTAMLTAAAAFFGGTGVSDPAITLPAWNGSLEVTACQPFAMVFRPRGMPSNTDPLTLTWNTDYVVTITGGTASSDLLACGVGAMDCPDAAVLCVRMPMHRDDLRTYFGGLAGYVLYDTFGYGSLRYTGGTWDGTSPRVYVGSCHWYAPDTGLPIVKLSAALRCTITGAAGGPPTDVTLEVIGVGGYNTSLPLANWMNNFYFDEADINVTPGMTDLAVAACDPFTAYTRPTGGSWATYLVECDDGANSISFRIGFSPADAFPPYDHAAYGGIAESLVDCHAPGGPGTSGTDTTEAEEFPNPEGQGA